MQRLRMRYLILSNCLLLLFGCTTVYKELQPATGDRVNLQKFKPNFIVTLYRAEIDVVGNHLSGLLLVKKMPDSSLRMVFSNEIGLKFFDFEFSTTGNFKVYSIIKQMNKKSVIKTLRKDFQLLLMQDLAGAAPIIRQDSLSLYYIYPQSKGFNTYVTNLAGTRLVRMERASKTKAVMEMTLQNYMNGIPDSIAITHQNFNFAIGLKRIER